MVKVFVLIITETGKEEFVLKKIQEIVQVEYAYIVYGKYDIIAKLVTEERKIQVVLSKKIRRIKEVNSTESLIASSE